MSKKKKKKVMAKSRAVNFESPDESSEETEENSEETDTPEPEVISEPKKEKAPVSNGAKKANKVPSKYRKFQ
jgi:hypothetical protein